MIKVTSFLPKRLMSQKLPNYLKVAVRVQMRRKLKTFIQIQKRELACKQVIIK